MGPQARGPAGPAAPAPTEETELPKGLQASEGGTQQEQRGTGGPAHPRSHDPHCLHWGAVLVLSGTRLG